MYKKEFGLKEGKEKIFPFNISFLFRREKEM